MMKNYARVIFTVLMSFIFNFTVNASNPLQELQQKLNSFHGMRASFQQALFSDERTPPHRSSGTMAIQRPGKFRWETQKPNEQILIADGSLLWIYDVDLEQATKQKVDTTDSNSPALFLSGNVVDIPKRFTVKNENNANSVGFHLAAKSADDMFQSVTIFFQADKLSKMVVDTRIGQRSEFTFSKVEINPTFSNNTFHFKPPAGVDVLTN
ncbi:MAG: outer membrane lipoprotein chaperone LolA [Gammaproteobacteria bacterium]|nr:outer membrane lipoprotein chaperone LolA [Gammaproteobacteria bacterium]